MLTSSIVHTCRAGGDFDVLPWCVHTNLTCALIRRDTHFTQHTLRALSLVMGPLHLAKSGQSPRAWSVPACHNPRSHEAWVMRCSPEVIHDCIALSIIIETRPRLITQAVYFSSSEMESDRTATLLGFRAPWRRRPVIHRLLSGEVNGTLTRTCVS